MGKNSETIIANCKEGNFDILEDDLNFILDDETNHRDYIEAILLGNLKNFNLESMKLASTILDKKLKSDYERLRLLVETCNYNPDEMEKELDNPQSELSIMGDGVDELEAEKSKCEGKLEIMIQQINSYLSKYIKVMSQCGTIITPIIAKAYFDFLITLSGSPEDLELHVAQKLNLYSVCYRDNKAFLNEITLFYSELLALIQNINNMLELKTAIEDELIKLLEERAKKTIDGVNFSRTTQSYISEQISISEQIRNLYFNVHSSIYFYETLIRICSKNLEESKELLDTLVTSSSETVRILCCINIKFGIYDFSNDKSSFVAKLYNFLNQVNLWTKDNDVREEDKMMVMDLAKLIKIRYNTEFSTIEINYKLEQDKSYSVSQNNIEQDDYKLLFAFAEHSDIDNDSNSLLPIAHAYLLYDLILSNKIVFDEEEPPFVSEIRNNGFSRKLVNPNAGV